MAVELDDLIERLQEVRKQVGNAQIDFVLDHPEIGVVIAKIDYPGQIRVDAWDKRCVNIEITPKE